MAVAHYLEALDFQKDIVKVHTIFGGKNPHPNWLVGGVPCAINVDGTGAVGAINMERLNLVTLDHRSARSSSSNRSICRIVAAIGSFYKDWLYGGGLSGKSVMAYGDIPEHANDYSAKNLLLPRGAIINGNLNEVLPGRSRRSRADPGVRHPFLVQISRRDQGPAPLGRRHRAAITSWARTPRARRPISRSSTRSAKYSWIKSPRWRGNAVEVGPLARYIVGYAQGKPEFKEPVDKLLKTLDVARDRAVLDARPHRGARAGVPMGRRTRCSTSRTS